MKKIIGVIMISTLIVVIGAGVGYAGTNGKPSWLLDKEKIQANHDQKLKEWQSANASVVFAAKPDYTMLNAGASPLQNQGIYDATNTQLPLSGISQKEYHFTNIAYTPYDILIAGSYASDATKGKLIIITIDKKTAQENRKYFDFPNKGPITITKVQGNSVILYASNGNQGIYNLATGNIIWN